MHSIRNRNAELTGRVLVLRGPKLQQNDHVLGDEPLRVIRVTEKQMATNRFYLASKKGDTDYVVVRAVVAEV